MIDWDKELLEILKDPVFADVKPIQHRISSSDRLVKSFDEITLFVERNGRMPLASGDITEKGLYRRLEGIKSDKTKYDKCKPHDRLNLLDCSVVKEKSQDELLAEILQDPIFNISAETQSLFDLPEYMIKDIERAQSEYIGKRTKCEDFEQFEPLFIRVHQELNEGKRKLIKFKESHLNEGTFFVVSGIVAYLAQIHKLQKDKNHKTDGRIRCIYENGTESDILLRTLGKALFKDGYTIAYSENEDSVLEKHFTITNNDRETGYIYVLKSKSTDPDIAKYKHLYKIGFTTQSVEKRISNAKNEATYLFANVDIVATWKVYNVKSATIENAIHHLFDKVQLQLTVGKYTPKEWYVVPLNIIEEGINKLIIGEKITYDTQLQQLVSEL